jgi:hypothetical protein
MTGDYRGGLSLWDEKDGFFYDSLHLPDGAVFPLKVRSLVGLMPLLAVETIENDLLERLPDFKRRMNWFFNNRIYLRDSGNMACVKTPGEKGRRLLSIVNRGRLRSPKTNFCPTTVSGPFPSIIKNILTLFLWEAWPIPSATSRLNLKGLSSAEIPTGGVRSGFQSIIC